MSDVLAELRAAILRGEYAPRRRLIENDLVERHGTSRFVLRNALTRLADEGLVELHASATKIIEQLNGQLVRHQFRLSLRPGRPSVSLPEHLTIIEAVCARDPARAEGAMRAHLTSVIGALVTFAAPATSRSAR